MEYEYKDKKLHKFWLTRLQGVFISRHNRTPTFYGWLLLIIGGILILRSVTKPPQSNTNPDQVLKLMLKEQERYSINPKFRDIVRVPDPQEEEFRRIEKENQRGIDLPVIPVFDGNKHKKANPQPKVAPQQFGGGLDARPQPKVFPVSISHSPSFTCSQGTIPLLLIVFSRPDNVGGRGAIRKTWGKQDRLTFPGFNEPKWLTIFVMGRGYNQFDSEVENESVQYGDILQGDFKDTPHESTRKFMMAMKWISENMDNCKPKFFLKTEENIFQNMHAIVNWVEAKYAKEADGHHYVGKLLRKDQPIREESEPLYVPEKDYKADFFPDLIQGPVYLFSNPSFQAMARAMNRVTPIAMEDGYIGLLAEEAEILPKHNDHFHLLHKKVNVCHHLKTFFLYDVLPSGHLDIFKRMKIARSNPECLNAQEVDPTLGGGMKRSHIIL